jgi:PHD/YefM family antitoxin component YafN of YafNO toxin-antitoxin module
MPMRALAPTGTSPAEVAAAPVPIVESDSEEEDRADALPLNKTLRVYPFGVNRDRLSDAARHLRVPVVITNNQKEADAVITLKNYYRHQAERLQLAAQDGKLLIILKNNTIGQMQHALAHIFDIPAIETAGEEEEQAASGDIHFDDPTKQALLETEDAIHQVLNKGLTTAELPPAEILQPPPPPPQHLTSVEKSQPT